MVGDTHAFIAIASSVYSQGLLGMGHSEDLFMLCVVSLQIDLPAVGMAKDVRDLVGLMHYYSSCIYYTLCEFCNILLLGVHVSVCGPIVGAPHCKAGAQQFAFYYCAML